jgi:hypothetical protein
MSTDSDSAHAVDLVPVYSSAVNRNQGYGPGRAVHLGTEARPTLCGVHKTHPDLLLSSGFPIEDLREYLRADPDGALCKRCRAIARSWIS